MFWIRNVKEFYEGNLASAADEKVINGKMGDPENSLRNLLHVERYNTSRWRLEIYDSEGLSEDRKAESLEENYLENELF